MKVLVTGVRGQLGYDVLRELQNRGIDCCGVGRDEFDITDYDAANKFITSYAPDAVIHCSAYTAVDKAEDDVALCRAVNVGGTENIARVCKKIGAKMLHISTDYVFPGVGEGFYEVDDATGAKNVYGQTKLEGELAVQQLLDNYFIVRISWVFGINGSNFIKTMLRLAATHKQLTVVADQIGSPTYTADLAVLLADMVQTEKYGIYHATNEGVCSWAQLAETVFAAAGRDVQVMHVTSEQYPTRAVRPKNSRLSKARLREQGFTSLPAWQDAVARYVKLLQEQNT